MKKILLFFVVGTSVAFAGIVPPPVTPTSIGAVPATRTVNGHALSSNVSVTTGDLGATTVGNNIFSLTNPSAITFVKINANNTVVAENAVTFRTSLGLGTVSTLNTGTTSGTIPVLGTGGKLPAVDGSLLTNVIYRAKGVTFAAQGSLSALTQTSSTIPNASQVTLSFWLKMDDLSNVPNFIRTRSAGGANCFTPGFGFWGDTPTDVDILTTAEAGGGSSTYLDAAEGGFIRGVWNHILISEDLNHAAGSRLHYIAVNGVVRAFVTRASTHDTGPAFQIPFLGANIWVPNDVNSGQVAVELADYQLWSGVFVDPTVGGNLAKFYRDGKPVDPAVAIATFGTPAILFSGDSTGFIVNQGSGGTFTVAGTITNSATSPSDYEPPITVQLYDNASSAGVNLSVSGETRRLYGPSGETVLLDWSDPTKLKFFNGASYVTNAGVFTGDGSGLTNLVGDDTAYDATTWSGNTGVPTKNAVRDKFEGLNFSGPFTVTNSSATSGTVTFNSSSQHETIYLNSGSTIVSLTIALPSTTVVGQMCRINAKSIVTTLTVSGTIADGTGLTSLPAGGNAAYQAIDTSGTFIRIQ